MKTLFKGEEAYKHLEMLTETIGPRHGGSKNEYKAAQKIRDHFKKLGLKTKLEKYPIYSFEDAQAELKTPKGKVIPCKAVPVSASTPAKGITKDVIFLDDAHPVYLDESIKDKIVVMFNSFNGELMGKFHELGPAGLVTIQTNAHGDHFLGTGRPDTKRKFGSIPTVRMTYKDGAKLLKSLPKQLTLKLKTYQEKVTCGYNVVADLAGTSGEDDVIVLCAHYDSVWSGAGAVDNGGGTAGIMELARVYSEKGTPRNLRFIAFGGEEMGLWGSKGYVKKLKDEDEKLKKNKDFEADGLKTELDKISFVVNLDMMGPLYGKTTATSLGEVDIAASLRLLGKELRYPVYVRENEQYSSDNMPFNYVEIPSASFFRTGFGDWGGHTVNDIIDNCSPEGLEHVCAFIEQWIDRYLLGMHMFPFSKEMPDAAKNAVKKYFKDKNPLDYKIQGPQKKYKAKKK
jgi:aminopeptidase YwaD